MITATKINNKTYYIHTAWANADDGSVDFTTTEPDEDDEHAYIGTYTDKSSAESSDPDKYTWAEIVDEDDVEDSDEEIDYDEEIDKLNEEIDDETETTDNIVRTATEAKSNLSDTQEDSEKRSATYYQADMPDPEEHILSVNDQWYDTDDGNRLYIFDGIEWVDAQDESIAEANETATVAQELAESTNENLITAQTELSKRQSDAEQELSNIATLLAETNQVSEETQNAFNLLNKYIWLNGQEIILSDKDNGLNSGFVNRITSNAIQFYYNGELKAFIDSDGFHFAVGELEKELRIGNFLLSANTNRFDVIYSPTEE